MAKSTYKHKISILPVWPTWKHIIVQDNLHLVQWVCDYYVSPDYCDLEKMITENTVAIFRFKPKAKPIDLGELA